MQFSKREKNGGRDLKQTRYIKAWNNLAAPVAPCLQSELFQATYAKSLF